MHTAVEDQPVDAELLKIWRDYALLRVNTPVSETLVGSMCVSIEPTTETESYRMNGSGGADCPLLAVVIRPGGERVLVVGATWQSKRYDANPEN